MDTDKLSFLGGNEPSEPKAVAALEDAGGTPALQEAPSAQDAGETPALQTPAPPLSERETVGFYKAMQEERDRRQALEKQLAQFKAREAAKQPTEPLPLEAQVSQALYKANLDNSRKWAVKEYGADAVEKAFEWANARCEPTSPSFDPVFNAQVASSGDPYETAVQAYNREQLLTEAGQTDLAEFRAWKASQSGNPAPAAPPTAPLPKSLATASGTGGLGKGAVPVGEGEAFAALPFN